MNYAIYGAGSIALSAYNSIKKFFPNKNILCFLVTEIGRNVAALSDLPVKELAEFAMDYSDSDKNDIQIFIATPENVMEEIEQSLEFFGFHNHVRLNSSRWAEMQKYVFIREGNFVPLEIYPVGFNPSMLYVYKAMFYKDKILQTKTIDPNYIIPIQVGAVKTEVRVADVLDSVGDNISDRNGNYSELTGLYWIWKNRIENNYYGEDCYYGLAHYRRSLELSEDDLLRLKDNDIDVILPYPMLYEPNIEEHHKRYLSNEEWEAVLQALSELQPGYAKDLDILLKQEYFYNYNIIIAKNAILKDYCRWLFPILFRIEEINDPNKKKASNRYMGYVGETMETLYFMHNKDKFRIVHTGCKFRI